MSLVAVTYTCRAKHQFLTKFPDGDVSHRATLELDSQPGAPVNHWGSMVHKIDLCGPDAEAMDLGDKYILTLEQSL